LQSKEIKLETMNSVAEAYAQQRFVFIPGAIMRGFLMDLGALKNDFASLPAIGDNLPSDPTLVFRRSRNARYIFDYERSMIYRGKFQPFMLSESEDFVRHDSGTERRFRGVDDSLQLNTAFQALLRFKSSFVKTVDAVPRRSTDHSQPRKVCTVFHLRTITTPQLVGEPALEGVHSDGVEHTMTTMIGSGNMLRGSAETSLHYNKQTTGMRHDQVDPEWAIERRSHADLLDTLLIVDSERKHSLSPLRAQDGRIAAHRDMLILFTRSLATTGHASARFDSTEPHPDLPLELSP